MSKESEGTGGKDPHKATAYATDRPWKQGDPDPLHRTEYAKRIAETLARRTTQPEGLVVGLYGPWGEGKTSLLHMIEAHLAAEEVEAIWFNPWYFTSQDALIRGFFDELAQKLSLRLGTHADEFKRVLDKYGSLLSALPISVGGIDPGRAMTAVGGRITSSSLED